jgi:hypothetical protein
MAAGLSALVPLRLRDDVAAPSARHRRYESAGDLKREKLNGDVMESPKSHSPAPVRCRRGGLYRPAFGAFSWLVSRVAFGGAAMVRDVLSGPQQFREFTIRFGAH